MYVCFCQKTKTIMSRASWQKCVCVNNCVRSLCRSYIPVCIKEFRFRFRFRWSMIRNDERRGRDKKMTRRKIGLYGGLVREDHEVRVQYDLFSTQKQKQKNVSI